MTRLTRRTLALAVLGFSAFAGWAGWRSRRRERLLQDKPPMILRTYTRILTHDLDAALPPLQALVGRPPDARLPLPGHIELVPIGDFFLISGPPDALKPFVGVLGPVIVDNLDTTEAHLVQNGVTIKGKHDVPTGRLLFAEHPGGVMIEWLEWKPEVWEKVKAASTKPA